MPIKKAIFVVAGFGTRFLPATKAQPKEMLPIVDKPIIQYLVEEAVEAGIQEVIFVTGRGKDSIENHFDKNLELELALSNKEKMDKLNEVSKISKLASFAYVRQPVQKGDGHALLCARPFIDPTESVLVVFPDYLMDPRTKAIKKIIDFYRQNLEPVICGDIVPEDKLHKYGVMEFEPTENPDMVQVKKFIEKPKVGTTNSNLINAGYFVLTPEVINLLSTTESTNEDGEVRVADALVKLTEQNKPLYALKPQYHGYDCGSVIGFLKATVAFGLARKDMKEEFESFLNEVTQTFNSNLV